MNQSLEDAAATLSDSIDLQKQKPVMNVSAATVEDDEAFRTSKKHNSIAHIMFSV